ncbi:MAG: hypothetical protein AAF386_04720 [Pseudomonadota bacterium]
MIDLSFKLTLSEVKEGQALVQNQLSSIWEFTLFVGLVVAVMLIGFTVQRVFSVWYLGFELFVLGVFGGMALMIVMFTIFGRKLTALNWQQVVVADQQTVQIDPSGFRVQSSLGTSQLHWKGFNKAILGELTVTLMLGASGIALPKRAYPVGTDFEAQVQQINTWIQDSKA